MPLGLQRRRRGLFQQHSPVNTNLFIIGSGQKDGAALHGAELWRSIRFAPWRQSLGRSFCEIQHLNSVECSGWVFSGGRDINHDKRASFSDSYFEKLMFLRGNSQMAEYSLYLQILFCLLDVTKVLFGHCWFSIIVYLKNHVASSVYCKYWYIWQERK